jgi:hypothetical protein
MALLDLQAMQTPAPSGGGDGGGGGGSSASGHSCGSDLSVLLCHGHASTLSVTLCF